MKAPYGLEIIESCADCRLTKPGFFCGFSEPVLRSLDNVSHKSTLPAGAILFVEGQSSRGTFILCSGKVNLSTTSREGKILILKTAEAGEAPGRGSRLGLEGFVDQAHATSRVLRRARGSAAAGSQGSGHFAPRTVDFPG